MSKKSKKKRVVHAGADARRASPQAHAGRLKRVIAAAALAVCALLAGSYAATRLDPVRRAVGLRPLVTAPAQTPTPLPLSKEYVYAGGRLVATEEPTPAATPTPTPAGPPPTALTATGYFPTQTTVAVKLVWAAPAGATPTSYVVERASGRGANGLAYAAVGGPVTTLPTQANPYVDSGASPNTTYVYHVRAVYAGGYSDYSNQDVATTVRYSGDDPLIGANDPQQRPASKVRAADLTELRGVVEAVRALAGVGAGTWKSDPAPLFRGSILRDHFYELRSNLNPALTALGVTTLPADTTLDVGRPVKKEHVQDVREKVR
jgi:hypothetical protein